MGTHPLRRKCGECGSGLKVAEAHKIYKNDIDLLIARLGKTVLVCDCKDDHCAAKTVFVAHPNLKTPLQYTMSLTVFVNEWLLREEAAGLDWVSTLWNSEIWMRGATNMFFRNHARPMPDGPAYGDILPS